MTQHNVKHHVSSKHCSRCGGDADGMKCPKCGFTAPHYNPMHWKSCKEGWKMRVKCKPCGEAEDNCKC